jgi:hypothetical protein
MRRELKITWQLPTGTRSEAIDAEVAELLRESGMVSMAYAPESGSEATRKQIKKRMKTETLMGSVRDAVQARLNVAVFLVIWFPHDSPESVRENMPFIDHLVEAGVTDLSVGFYMALPGTELFHSLYAAGKIKVDRAYFRHILDSLALIPSQSYCDHLTPLSMTRWKLQMYWRFYRAQSSLAASILRGLLSKSGHQSKLQTALRNARVSLWKGVVSLVGGRWISRADERQMFSGWDAIYRKIEKTRQDRLAENERAGSAYSPHLKDETLVGDPTSGSSLRNAPPQF